jgi:hypothetical protein
MAMYAIVATTWKGWLQHINRLTADYDYIPTEYLEQHCD